MQHDATYKAAFTHTRMMRDQLLLLEQLVGDRLPMLRRLRLDTLQRLSSEYLTDNLERRFGDMVWRVGLQPALPDDEAEEPHWLHILVMLEFQSRPEWIMAARVQNYASLLYLALHKEKPFSASNPIPPVLPIVLYNGSTPWRAPLRLSALKGSGMETVESGPAGVHVAPMELVGDGYILVDQQALLGEDLLEDNAATLLAWIEGLKGPKDMPRLVKRCYEWLSEAEDGSLLDVLMRKLEAWIGNADIQDAQEWRMKLIRIRESAAEVVRQPIDFEERIARWERQVEARGRAEGEETALARERALLERMVALRFGGDTAERFGVLLAGVSDPERLAEVGEWIIECEDGASLLARMAQ